MPKRPLLIVIVAYILGIICSVYIDLGLIILISLICFILCLLFIDIKKNIIFVLVVLFMFNIGGIYSYYKGNIQTSKVAAFKNQKVLIEGTFIENVKQNKDFVSFVADVHAIDEVFIEHEKIKVNYYSSNYCKKDFNYGDLITIQGKVKVPQVKRNPGGFNYRRYLLTKNIYTIISARNVKLKGVGEGNFSKIIKFSLFLKNRIVHVIERTLPNKQASLLEGVLLSKKDSLDEQIKNSFLNAGLTHLMAVSGLHVSFIIIPFIFIFSRLKFPKLISNLIITIVLLLFIIITGSSPSVVRAAIMALVILYGELLYRKSDVLTSLSFAALLMLIYNPFILFSVGFQLSYIATLSIVLLYSKIKTLLYFLPKYLKDLVSVTLSAQIGVIPIIMFYFNKVSIISIISNILAVPVLGIVLLLGLFIITIGQLHIFLAEFFGGLNYLLLSYLSFIAQKTSAIPFSTLTVSSPKIYIILFYYAVILVAVLFKKEMLKKVNKTLIYKLAFCLFIIYGVIICFYTKPLEVSFLDVGQGDSIFIRTPTNKVILIDGGGYSNEDFDPGEKIITPFLLDKGINNIDIIMLSHMDYDHVNGIKAIIRQFDVKTFIISCNVNIRESDLFNIVKKNNIKIIPIKYNGKVKVEKNLRFRLYSSKQKYDDLNDDQSLVVKLFYKNKTFLFTGDISSNIENKLVKKFDLTSDILKVAHHGSKSSTSKNFLNAVKPKIAVISASKHNFYGHPHKQVINRLKQKKINIFRTDKNGCVSVFTNGNYIKVKTMNGVNMNL